MCRHVGMCSLSQKLPTESFPRKNPARAYTSLHGYTPSSEKLFALGVKWNSDGARGQWPQPSHRAIDRLARSQ
jgi:hypothetical protein